MRITLATLLTLATIASATAQEGPPSAEVRALRQTNSELMQAWVGARTALAQALDELSITKTKLDQAQGAKPRQGDVPMHQGNPAAIQPYTPTQEAPAVP